MKYELSAKKITGAGASRRRCRNLYLQAFPKIERVSFSKLFSCCREGTAELWEFCDGDDFVGFAYVLLGGYAYLLFCAICPDVRSRGYGSEMIRLLRQAYPDRDMVLDIEPPCREAANAEERMRRCRFYLKCGFKDTGWEMSDETGNYRIFTSGDSFDPSELEGMYSILPPMFPDTEMVRAEDLFELGSV